MRKTNSNFLRSKRLVIFELMRTEFSRRMLILFLYSQCCLSGQNCQLTPERGDWRENHLRSYLQLISFKGDRGMKFFLRIMMRTILRKMNSNFLRSKRLVIFELMRTEFSRRMLILFLYSQCCLSGQNCQLTPERGDWRENHLRSYLQLVSFRGD